MPPNEFYTTLEQQNNFALRRIIERLRDGLFDPLGVTLLTAHEDKLRQAFKRNLAENRPHRTLNLCGDYGQGKSHSLTYLQQLAREKGFVTSRINLDPRETPFHDFRLVYRALIEQIKFPQSDLNLAQWWKKFTAAPEQKPLSGLLPATMPHYFKCVLTAMAQKNLPLTRRQKQFKKHATFRPREFPWLLSNALKGDRIPVAGLRRALKYRQVPFYKDNSLVCKGWEPYLEMTYALAELFKNAGFKGWVILFDEGESIIQRAISARRKSYAIFHRLNQPHSSTTALYPVFAFTETFFIQIQSEDYERPATGKNSEGLYFNENYAEAWRDLQIHRLHEPNPKEWRELSEKLILIHARAYNWQPETDALRTRLDRNLQASQNQTARFRIKELVNLLDCVQQQQTG